MFTFLILFQQLILGIDVQFGKFNHINFIVKCVRNNNYNHDLQNEESAHD